MPEIPNRIFESYELLASGDGQRLEHWKDRVIIRPESAAVWSWHDKNTLPPWDGLYSGDRATGGQWNWRSPLPDPCVISYGNLSFLIKPTNSKHLGLFPEQSTNWDWITSTISASTQRTTPVKVLNLFGYTGGATLAAAASGASVTHVDAARAMVGWCSENARLSGLAEATIRYIVEDAVTFLQREIRRGNHYDGIIMDPPSFGRGKGGELWNLSEHLPFLIDTAQEALTENPLFLLLNTYSGVIDDLAESMITKRLSRLGGSCDIVKLGQTGTLDHQWLPGGIAHRWVA
ncbi:MAG: class I SAM-dependent methyltransferase [Verrucomicrobia bacterium]|nr:class I SAM-dependent methyltransferase [Verrucomicrobiota bacterium]